jgi:NADH-quinone oxidoreductase subunit J
MQIVYRAANIIDANLVKAALEQVGVPAFVVFQIVSVVWTRSLGIDVTTGAASKPADYSNTAELGKVLYTEYVYAFELAAVLLLIAIIAAISLTMRKRANLKQQDVAKQVAVRREDRVRVVQVAAERANDTKASVSPAPATDAVAPGKTP